MDQRRVRNIVGITLGVLLVVGFGLGRLFGGVPEGPASSCDQPLAWHQASEAIGEHAAIVGPVAATAHEPDIGGGPTFLNLGQAHPDPDRFDVVIYEEARERFDVAPEVAFDDEEICVFGRVRDRDGVPQIIVDSPASISLR